MPVYYCNAFAIYAWNLNAKIYNLDTEEYDVQNGVIWIMCDTFIISSKNMRMNLKKIIYKKNIRMGRYHLVEQPLQV